MGELINQEEAREYRKQVDDVVVRGLLTQAFGLLLLSVNSPQGDFDVLYFTRIVHDLVKDKESLMRELSGFAVANSWQET